MVQSLEGQDNLNRWRRELPKITMMIPLHFSPSSPHDPGTDHCKMLVAGTNGGGGVKAFLMLRDVVREARAMYETGDDDFEDFQNVSSLAKRHNAEPWLMIFSARFNPASHGRPHWLEGSDQSRHPRPLLAS